jgi:hypothetical protein
MSNVSFEGITGRKLSKADAVEANAELEKILAEHGRVTSALVLEEARSSASVLHKHFNWDDTSAAEERRLDQAGDLIRSVRVILRSGPHREVETVRAWLSVQDDAGRNYQPVATVLSVEETRRQILSEALAELDTLKKKYRLLSELAVVFAAVEAAQVKHAPASKTAKKGGKRKAG